MSRASRRVCTREEDTAYCLLGIFGLNMSLLYGEGKNAFRRLRTEIINITDDELIFAWTIPELSDRAIKGCKSGLLAPSPAEFMDSGAIVPCLFEMYQCPYSMTSKGLRVPKSGMATTNEEAPILVAIALNYCSRREDDIGAGLHLVMSLEMCLWTSSADWTTFDAWKASADGKRLERLEEIALQASFLQSSSRHVVQVEHRPACRQAFYR